MPKTKSKTKPIPKLLPESFTEELTDHLNKLFADLCKLHQGNAIISNIAINGIPLKDLRAKHEMNNDLLNLAEQLNKLLNNPQEYEPLAKILGNPNEPKPIKQIAATYNVAELKRRIPEVTKLWAEIFLLKHKQDFLIKENSRLAEKQLIDKPPRKRKKPDPTESDSTEKESKKDMDTIIQLTKRMSKIEEELEENQKNMIELKNQSTLLSQSNSAKDVEIQTLQQEIHQREYMKKRKAEDPLELEKDQLIKKLKQENVHLTSENHRLSLGNERLSEDNEFYKGARKHFKLKSASFREENQGLLEQLSAIEAEYQEKNNKLSDQLTQTELDLKKSNDEVNKLKNQLTLVTNSRQQLIEKVNNHGKKHLQKAETAKNATPPQHLRAANQTRKALTHFFYSSPKTELFLAQNLVNIRINKRANTQEAKQILDNILNNNKADQQTKQKANELKQEIIQKNPGLA